MKDGKPETPFEAFEIACARLEGIKGLRNVASLRSRADTEALEKTLRDEAVEVWPPLRRFEHGSSSSRTVVTLQAIAFDAVRRAGDTPRAAREVITIHASRGGGSGSGIEIPVQMVGELRRELRRMLDDLDDRGWVDS